MNVALYARGASAWSLAERTVRNSDRSESDLSIGASTMRWDGDRLVVSIDERTTPLGRPIRGSVVLHPEARTSLEHAIDETGGHLWWPIAPLARIEVSFSSPALSFSGHAYHDANAGNAPIESTFDTWNWSRARSDDGALLTYDVTCSSGSEHSLGFRVSPRGEVEALGRSSRATLGRTTWGVERHVRVDEGQASGAPRLVRSLENGPFYSRALVETKLGGQTVLAMHESLAAHRLRRAWVRCLTRCRMRTFA